MQKANAIIKVDTEENWDKAKNYIPDCFTVLIYQYENKSPKIKIGDGIHKVSELPFLNKNNEIEDDTLIL